MAFSKVASAQVSLLNAHKVDIEVDLNKGFYAFSIVGLPDKAVEESRDRTSAAIKNSGYKSPKNKNQKIVISLAPADLKKEGPLFDLGIALAYLRAAGDIDFDPAGRLFLGELSLDGGLRPIRGALPIAKKAAEWGVKEIYLPKENAAEAALIEGVSVYGASTLKEVADHLNTKKSPAEDRTSRPGLEITPKTELPAAAPEEMDLDFSDIKGQETAKRGLLIAAAGGHNIAMWGPPGTGKTMLARAFCGILPPLSFDEALEVSSIHSVAGTLREPIMTDPPFRSPHHTSSHVALVGGGTIPKPGEATLSHRGVLFLDEFPEFESRVLESLREPLEDGIISISRAKGSARFPARFTLVAAMNPCPCGNFGVRGKECTCAPAAIARYHRKLSGPILDRIDMWVEVSAVDHSRLTEKRSGESESLKLRKEVAEARRKQKERFKKAGLKISLNSEMGARAISEHIKIAADAKKILDESAKKLDLSARAYHRTLKLARTIADLESADAIDTPHILEAVQYRARRR